MDKNCFNSKAEATKTDKNSNTVLSADAGNCPKVRAIAKINDAHPSKPNKRRKRRCTKKEEEKHMRATAELLKMYVMSDK